MRKAIVAVLVVLVLAILAGAMHVLDRRAARAEPGNEPEPGKSPSSKAESPHSSPARERPEVAMRGGSEARAEREAMRRRILEAMHARERAAAEPEGGGTQEQEPPSATTEDAPRLPSDAQEPDDASGEVGTVIDRTGTHADHVKVVNEDLIPLTDECYALARETTPELAGMLVLDFELIGDEDIGGVIESVQLGQGNELFDPGLVECVQESILSITLPPPDPEHGGRDAISLSLRLSPDEE